MAQLAPSDGIVALRSLERRFRGMFAEADEEETPDQLAARPGADGWTILDHIVAATWSIVTGARAVEAVLVQDMPIIAPADADTGSKPRTPTHKPTGTLHEQLAELGVEANRLADRAERVASKDWDRRGLVAPHGRSTADQEVTALDLFGVAVEASTTHLRAAERTLARLLN